MAYTPSRLSDISELTDATVRWTYGLFTDSLTTIRASGYFDPAAPQPNQAGDILVNDLIQITGVEGTQVVEVTGLAPITVILKETTISVSLAANPVPADTIDLKLCFSGDCLTLFLPELDVAGNNNAGLISYSGIPLEYRPRMEHQYTGLAVRDSGTYSEGGTLTVDTGGTIEIGLTNAVTLGFIDPTNFSATVSNCGHQGIFITYLVA